ncbi:50S ribosomal protein L11 methyltransferase [Faecalibacter rhinopitheci]|uniref:Ribosomal protein L11 methyltransferase n=1 Tax=Faecalibacter rhinopitheci TaxID=2779678 RepID=A0A8J7G9N3_9FLAO|nr:50S ribosomal protein L11 methyltransferase [Faecalibacter rhinopitheci]MBF0598055.1 50S ribosomal protein L11 methyltransferase [Faecalibacter rhinopitheci]
MTNYIEYKFQVKEIEPWNEIIIANISDLPFESFTENENGFDAYIPSTQENEAEIKEVLESLEGIDFTYTRTEIEQQNWNATWEENFTPILVNDQCLIRAEFHDTIENIPFEIVIQPKMSFGTGHHSTTHLMVEYILETEFTGKDILDMGCGTSILAILALKKNANYAECIDIDEWAVENSIENGKRNGVSLDAKMGDNSLLGSKHFDVILANINKNILIAQIPSYIEVLNEGGDLFLSGLMEQDFNDIHAFCTERNLTFISKKQRNEWIAIHFKK